MFLLGSGGIALARAPKRTNGMAVRRKTDFHPAIELFQSGAVCASQQGMLGWTWPSAVKYSPYNNDNADDDLRGGAGVLTLCL